LNDDCDDGGDYDLVAVVAGDVSQRKNEEEARQQKNLQQMLMQ
jgi:hypothetical protein